MNLVLGTPRLILREMCLADLDFVASMLAHPDVMRFYPKCYSREEAEAWVRRQQDRYARTGTASGWSLKRQRAKPWGRRAS